MRPFLVVLMVAVAAAMIYGLAIAVGWTDNPFKDRVFRTASADRTTTETVADHKIQKAKVKIEDRKRSGTLVTESCISKTRQARLTGLEAPKAKRELALPDYPERSMERHEEGRVGLNLCIDEDGRVQEVKITQSSGYAALDESAQKTAARQWRFEPASHKGKTVALWMPIGVRFSCFENGKDFCSNYN